MAHSNGRRPQPGKGEEALCFLLQGLPTVFSLWPPWLPVLLNHMGLSLVLIGAPADGYQTLLFAVFFPAPLAALLSLPLWGGLKP